MPASSIFAEVDRPVSAPNNQLNNGLNQGMSVQMSTTNQNSPGMEDHIALHLALELTKLGINDQQPQNNSSTDVEMLQGLVESERNRRTQNMTECVAVPSSEHVAEIVGRQGCKIKALRAKTNTYIKTPVRGEEPVFVVTGRKEDVASAKKEILSAAEHFSQIRACRKNNLNGSMAPGPPTNIPGQITIQVRVPYRVVGLVVGPKGATIKRIQQQTHTYIVTPSRDKEPVFEVTGLPDSVDQARKEIEAHIAMRTGGLVDNEDAVSATAAAAAAAAAASAVINRNDFSSTGLENLFSSSGASSELVNSLYKLNGYNGMGLGSLNGSLASTNSSLGGISNSALNNVLSNGLSNGLANGLNGVLTNGLGNSLSNFREMNYPFENGTSMLSNKPNGLDSSIFSTLGNSLVNKLGELNGSGPIGNLLNDEGLGSLTSSMGSSPSFDPVASSSSSIWGDIGRTIGPSLTSTVNSSSLASTLSSMASSATRRSSSVSGASPPSSRLSPSFEGGHHVPARRSGSDPAPGGLASSLTSLSIIGNGVSGASSGNSPTSTPELHLGEFSRSDNCKNGSTSPTNDGRCHICSEAGVVAALVPCGHNYFCMECANKLVEEHGACPICLSNVTQAIRIFTP